MAATGSVIRPRDADHQVARGRIAGHHRAREAMPSVRADGRGQHGLDDPSRRRLHDLDVSTDDRAHRAPA
jgi:hypothetical protein